MAPIRRFEDIEGWKKSDELLDEFTRITPALKDPWLKDQMERGVESALANIAEGFDSGSNPEFVRFLNMAFRSLSEFQSHLHVCKRKHLLIPRDFDRLYAMAKEAKSKVGGFIRYFKAHPCGKPRTQNRTPNERRTRN
jgi:four helix bundle protein